MSPSKNSHNTSQKRPTSKTSTLITSWLSGIPVATVNLPSPSSREAYRLMVVPLLQWIDIPSTEDQLQITDRLALLTCMGLATTDTLSQALTEDRHSVEELNTICLQQTTGDTRTRNKRSLRRKHGEPNSTWSYSFKANAMRSKSHVWPQRRLSKSGMSSIVTRIVSSLPTLSREFCKTTHNSTFLTPTSTTSTKPSDPERSLQESQTPNSSKHSAVSSQELKTKNRMVQTNKRREKIIMKETTSSRTVSNKWTQKHQ